MQLTSVLVAAALSACAAADFVVVTARPTPTNLNDLLNLSSYISSLGDHVTSALASVTANPSAKSEAARMNSALRSFAATASYSIPAKVTEAGSFETFTSVPAWYSALPSDVKSYYDKNNKVVESLLLEAAGVKPSSTESGSAGASGAKATQTAGANKVAAAVGAGLAAALAGVAAL